MWDGPAVLWARDEKIALAKFWAWQICTQNMWQKCSKSCKNEQNCPKWHRKGKKPLLNCVTKKKKLSCEIIAHAARPSFYISAPSSVLLSFQSLHKGKEKQGIINKSTTVKSVKALGHCGCRQGENWSLGGGDKWVKSKTVSWTPPALFSG